MLELAAGSDPWCGAWFVAASIGVITSDQPRNMLDGRARAVDWKTCQDVTVAYVVGTLILENLHLNRYKRMYQEAFNLRKGISMCTRIPMCDWILSPKLLGLRDLGADLDRPLIVS
jgi:hypothetical protein